MTAVNIRTLTDNFSKYLTQVKKGEKITIMKRNVPIADIVPYTKHLRDAGWM